MAILFLTLSYTAKNGKKHLKNWDLIPTASNFKGRSTCWNIYEACAIDQRLKYGFNTQMFKAPDTVTLCSKSLAIWNHFA